MSNLVIYGALYTDNGGGKCKQAGVAFEVKHKDIEGVFEDISADKTYGDMWLTTLSKIIINMNTKGLLEGVKEIKLITAQIQTEKMGKKIERIVTEALEKDRASREEIAQLVFKDGRHTPRPNNGLYTELVFNLVAMCRNQHVYFKHEHLPCVHTMDLVKGLHKKIAPGKVLIDKTKPKKPKTKPPL